MKNKIFKLSPIKKKINFILFLYFSIIKFNEQFNYIKKPKVSVFLPIYNKQLYLKRSIRSIQVQTLKNLEIVAVNDFSFDNSLKILKKLTKKDSRIKIINNDRNHGLLYSRAMGILNCTGEYVLNLDPDDMISNINNLRILYKKAKKKNTDLIIFKLKKIKMFNINISEFNKIIKDFKLNKKNSNTPVKNHYLITNKFIKREIILKVYKIFKNKIYKNKWNYHEDHIWSILINKYSKSRILLNEYIYLYLLNRESLMRNIGNILEFKNKIYRFEMLQKIFKNNFYIFNKLLVFINKNKIIIKKELETNIKLIYILVNFIIFYKNNKSHFLKNIINKISSNESINISKNSSKMTFIKL